MAAETIHLEKYLNTNVLIVRKLFLGTINFYRAAWNASAD